MDDRPAMKELGIRGKSSHRDSSELRGKRGGRKREGVLTGRWSRRSPSLRRAGVPLLLKHGPEILDLVHFGGVFQAEAGGSRRR